MSAPTTMSKSLSFPVWTEIAIGLPLYSLASSQNSKGDLLSPKSGHITLCLKCIKDFLFSIRKKKNQGSCLLSQRPCVIQFLPTTLTSFPITIFHAHFSLFCKQRTAPSFQGFWYSVFSPLPRMPLSPKLRRWPPLHFCLNVDIISIEKPLRRTQHYAPGTIQQFILLLSQHFSLTGILFVSLWLPLWNVHSDRQGSCLSCLQPYASF